MSSKLRVVLAVALWVSAAGVHSAPLGDHVVLVWNDLGMHCMNRDHATLSILPPYNTLEAQVLQRGDATHPPVFLTSGITLTYSIPGNTYSVGKTDFWDWDVALFGVDLPPDVGLTGLGLTGEFTFQDGRWRAEGIPVTPFPDATPNVENPYQLAEVIAWDASQVQLAASRPVIPTSTEVNCVASGCHSSEQGILNQHEDVSGFDPAATPILCAGCHASPALGTPGIPEAGYFSFRIHDQHKFLDETMPGLAGCQMCHPGPQANCLRGTMATDYGMICQDCHGDLQQVSGSIEHQGRVPWEEEPACRDCHTAQYGEPVGQLYRNSTGHGGVACIACHGSPHAIWPSREVNDNEMAMDLQGHAGALSDCTVCHGVIPAGPGPHGMDAPSSVNFTPDGVSGLTVFPSPVGAGVGVTVRGAARPAAPGRLLIFDARGRTVRMLRSTGTADGRVELAWDGRTAAGAPVSAGTYFLRWDDGGTPVTGKMQVVK